MEAWQIGVDRQLGELRGDIGVVRVGRDSDVKWMLGALTAGFIILAGGGWTAYAKLSDKIVDVEKSQVQTSGDVRTLDAKMSGKLDVLIERSSQRTLPKQR